jgi:hypothetical protein
MSARAVLEQAFDYARLEPAISMHLSRAAAGIRERLKRSLEDIVVIGRELLGAKEALPHGTFLRWLKAEFGWTERTARNLMAVAQRFGNSEIISDLRIQPTAAYLLAAPSTPDEARETAVKRAEQGELITASIAKELVTMSRKRQRRRRQGSSVDSLRARLGKSLVLYRMRWQREHLTEMADCLREFAAELDKRTGRARVSQ